MSTVHNSTMHRQHHYRASLKKKLKEVSHKLLDTHRYSRHLHRPQENVRYTNYNDRRYMSSFSDLENDLDPRVDAYATDFIESMHKKFELSNTMSMMGG